MYEFLSIDLPPLLTTVFAAVSCALLGNYLVLRRLSLMGDAIAHAVLPGIVVAFLVTGSRASFPVFVGAAAAGLLTAICVETVRKLGRIETGAAMGVVFSIFFAVGVLLLEQADARSVDLDADCLLHGQPESIFWFPPQQAAALLSWSTLELLPLEVKTSLLVLLLTIAFVVVLYKELALAAFDAQLATALGFNATLLHHLLMVFVAGAVVVSFQAVGSIIVIAMLICPAAAARMLTDRLHRQLLLSVLFALIGAVGGYLAAGFGPQLLGYSHSVSSAGMIAGLSGLMLGSAVLFGPQYGIVARQLRRLRLAVQMAREDLLGDLYRSGEAEAGGAPLLRGGYLGPAKGRAARQIALSRALHRKEVQLNDQQLTLTAEGFDLARSIVRSHRLWESYLVDQAGLRPDHVHDRATELEHFTTSGMRRELAAGVADPQTDPHGKTIPPGRSDKGPAS